MTTQTIQKPQPRILTFTKPDNIRGSVHGKITAYQELWNYVESLRYNNHNLEKDPIIYKARNSILNPIFSNILCELKSLGCKEVGFAEKWIDNDRN